MEVIGAGSAILTLVLAFNNMSKRLLKYADRLKHAQDDLQKLGTETKVFATLLRHFHTSLDENKDVSTSNFSKELKAFRVDQDIERAGRECLQKLRGVLRLAKDLRDDKHTTFPFVQRWKARVRWNGHLEDRKSISSDIHTVYSSAQMLMTIVGFDRLFAVIQQLNARHAPIPQVILDEMCVSYLSRVSVILT